MVWAKMYFELDYVTFIVHFQHDIFLHLKYVSTFSLSLSFWSTLIPFTSAHCISTIPCVTFNDLTGVSFLVHYVICIRKIQGSIITAWNTRIKNKPTRIKNRLFRTINLRFFHLFQCATITVTDSFLVFSGRKQRYFFFTNDDVEYIQCNLIVSFHEWFLMQYGIGLWTLGFIRKRRHYLIKENRWYAEECSKICCAY